MSFNYINKIIFYISLFFIISCQGKLFSDNKKNDKDLNQDINIIEKIDKIDLSINNISQNKIIDFYTNQNINFNFSNEKLIKIKVNNYEGKTKDFNATNVIYIKTKIYSINSKGKILEFDEKTGKLLNRYNIEFPSENKTPTSFSLIDT